MATIEQLYEHLRTLNKQWFHDKDELEDLLDGKLDAVDIPTRTSDLTNDGDGNNAFLTQHQDISGKANIVDLSDVATSGSYTDLLNIPESFAPTSHEHNTSEIKDSNAYSNLGTSANATQSAINYAINSRLGNLLSVDLVEVVSTLPTASASTLNKLYMTPESTTGTNNSYEIFVTVSSEDDSGAEPVTVYDWERIDSTSIDLTGYSTTSHVHGNITSDGKVGSNANYFVYTTTGGEVTSKQTIGNITVNGTIGNSSGKVLVTDTNGVITTSDTITELDATIQSLITYGTSLENNNGD